MDICWNVGNEKPCDLIGWDYLKPHNQRIFHSTALSFEYKENILTTLKTFIYGWRPRLNIKTVLSTYGDFHVKDKTAVRTSYLYMGIAIPGKTVFLIETAPWIR